MDPNRYVRHFDNRMERLAAPQEPARIRLGKPVTHTGMILPYGRGGYRHSFMAPVTPEQILSGGMGDCGCAGGCGGLGAEGKQGLPFMAMVILLGGGAVLAYTLLQAVKS